MNQRPSGSMLLSKAIAGFINYKNAEGLSARTIDSHERILAKRLEHVGNQELHKITSQAAIVWVTLLSFFSWASLELGIKHIMKDVPAPRTKQVAIEPLTQDEVQLS